MKISSVPQTLVSQKLATSQPTPPPTSQDDGPSIVDKVANLSVPVVSVGAGGTAAYFASKLVEFGSGGVLNAIGGAALGVAAGGATGYVLYKLFADGGDAAGRGMAAGLLTLGGAVAGGVAGGVSGAFGAQALITAPAAVLGTATGLLAAGAARNLITGD